MASIRNKFFPGDRFDSLTIFTFPFRLQTLLVLVIFSCLFLIATLMASSGETAIFSAVWWFIIGGGFIQYCFVILDYTSRGHQEPPKLDWETFRPFADTRLIQQVLIIGMMIATVAAIPHPILKLVFSSLCFFVLPAVTAFLVLEYSASRALNPVRLFDFIGNMGFTYTTMRLVVSIVLLIILTYLEFRSLILSSFPGTVFAVFCSTYLVLIMYRATGALLHCRRTELGLRTDFSPEQDQQNRQDKLDDDRSLFVSRLHNLCRRGKNKLAWEKLEAVLEKDGYETVAEYHHLLQQWEIPLLGIRLSQSYIPVLLDRGDVRLAWQTFEKADQGADGNLRRLSGKAVLDLCVAAENTVQWQLSAKLLGFFQDDFPHHPMTRQANLLAASIQLERLNNLEEAAKIFDLVTGKRGRISRTVYDRLYAQLRSG